MTSFRDPFLAESTPQGGPVFIGRDGHEIRSQWARNAPERGPAPLLSGRVLDEARIIRR